MAKTLGVLFLVIGIGAGFAYIYNTPDVSEEAVAPVVARLAVDEPDEEPSREPNVVIGNRMIPVELAVTDTQRQKGLSGRATLPADEGMLFIFSKPDIYSFWMPDMNFPIDIIWINAGQIVDIHENVSNKFEPANPVFYKPDTPARYVLEVNAGFAKRHGLDIGDAVILNNIE